MPLYSNGQRVTQDSAKGKAKVIRTVVKKRICGKNNDHCFYYYDCPCGNEVWDASGNTGHYSRRDGVD